ncbi:MAG: hypothetical protein H6999_07760 [Hahellaceae bacterium]|nr:hypothetical protein [Hahellaceae bacterium]MCP5169637.1 hypothetical protein [Hahellaceae bacterium]
MNRQIPNAALVHNELALTGKGVLASAGLGWHRAVGYWGFWFYGFSPARA